MKLTNSAAFEVELSPTPSKSAHALVLYGWRQNPNGSLDWLLRNTWGAGTNEVHLAAHVTRTRRWSCGMWPVSCTTLTEALQPEFDCNRSDAPNILASCHDPGDVHVRDPRCGIWSAVHGQDGIEFISVMIVHGELIGFKLTGARNVPPGRKTWRIPTWQSQQSEFCKGFLVCRKNPKDPNGFYEKGMRMEIKSGDTMVLHCNEGGSLTFHRLVGYSTADRDSTWSGVWKYSVTSGHPEYCVVRKNGSDLEAVKLQGNSNVHAGQIIWKVPCSPPVGSIQEGQSQWAQKSQKDIHWRQCELHFKDRRTIISKNKIEFTLQFGL